ncbi:hypothetical protein FGO68_gene11157 [Halteria grandinella]|uniref:Uncharacterized protein n=1 Tax=Halteria grandinella TaxID=5974 RepID=A0A8J8NZE0_HALGN|nr:hypothetical protein FGO68_gene11157 [Halteria grandinella]
MLGSSSSHNNLIRGDSQGHSKPSSNNNRNSLTSTVGNSGHSTGLSKTQNIKSTKIQPSPGQIGGYSMNSSTNTLAMMLSSGAQANDEEGGAKRVSTSHYHQAATPERKVMNAIVHARNLSSQNNPQQPSWMVSKPKGIPSGLGTTQPTSQTARPHYNLKPTASISPLRPKNTNNPEQQQQFMKPQPAFSHHADLSTPQQVISSKTIMSRSQLHPSTSTQAITTMIDLSNRDHKPASQVITEEDNCASQTSTSHRDRIRKLKADNQKLYLLLTETEDKFKSKIDQSRKESLNIMKIIAQILPYVRNALKQNQHDQEAKELIRQIEQNTAFTTSAMASTNDKPQSNESDKVVKQMQAKIERLDEELADLREQHQREIIMLQQESNQQKQAYEQIIIALKQECLELRAFKSSVELYTKAERDTQPSFLKASGFSFDEKLPTGISNSSPGAGGNIQQFAQVAGSRNHQVTLSLQAKRKTENNGVGQQNSYGAVGGGPSIQMYQAKQIIQ